MKVAVQFMMPFGQKFGIARNGVQNFESIWHVIIYVNTGRRQKYSEPHIL